ncbi:hypothetical protein [Dyadobacter tibetensis]|uniref:hypothetical protein n=1 Tax=Dyadobacter tibetensis TaxID=1211851 RepID=UPI000472BA7B|nr:hypothetical protein [Dyadobacter tibetensis]
MTETSFLNKKEKLKQFIDLCLSKTDQLESLEPQLKKLKEILEKYNYENRIESKGTLTRTIIDSLELPYTLGEKFIYFDNSIT